MYLSIQLMLEIKSELKNRKLTQIHAATLFGVSQPRVSDLVYGRVDRFTLDMLINWLSKLGKRVDLGKFSSNPNFSISWNRRMEEGE